MHTLFPYTALNCLYSVSEKLYPLNSKVCIYCVVIFLSQCPNGLLDLVFTYQIKCKDPHTRCKNFCANLALEAGTCLLLGVKITERRRCQPQQSPLTSPKDHTSTPHYAIQQSLSIIYCLESPPPPGRDPPIAC